MLDSISPGHIRELRRAMGNLTQEDFAHRLHLSLETVREWEQGRCEPGGLLRRAVEQGLRHFSIGIQPRLPLDG